MSDKTVRELAGIIKIPLERLLEQLKEANLSVSLPDDVISETEKAKLLAHLRKRHGKEDETENASPNRVVLKRRKVSEIKQATAHGTAGKTISVEVRKEKTYIKRKENETTFSHGHSTENAPVESKIIAEENHIIEKQMNAVIENNEMQNQNGLETNENQSIVTTETSNDLATTSEKPLFDDLDDEPEVVVEAKFAVAIKENKKIKHRRKHGENQMGAKLGR